MISGKTITLASVAWGSEINNVLPLLDFCKDSFPFFDDVELISHINNLYDYNRFMVEDLNNFISTDFVMIVQSDGFIINPKMWRDEFLNYDYIGAPWPFHNNLCGNGGFCIRSKKFLQISSTLKYKKDHKEYPNCPEDSFLCLPEFNRQYMLDNGIKFADARTAIEFSFEHQISNYPNNTIKNSFGFHGKHNL